MCGKGKRPLAAQQPGLMSLLCASKVACCPLNSDREREEAAGRVSQHEDNNGCNPDPELGVLAVNWAVLSRPLLGKYRDVF